MFSQYTNKYIIKSQIQRVKYNINVKNQKPLPKSPRNYGIHILKK